MAFLANAFSALSSSTEILNYGIKKRHGEEEDWKKTPKIKGAGGRKDINTKSEQEKSKRSRCLDNEHSPHSHPDLHPARPLGILDLPLCELLQRLGA
jgi:hypothetical protein